MQGQCIGSGRKGHLVLGNGHSLFLPLVRGLGRAQSAHIQGRKGFIYGETRLRPFMAPRSKSDRMNEMWEFTITQDGTVVAEGSGPDKDFVEGEAWHYWKIYAQDGPTYMKFGPAQERPHRRTR